MAGQGWGLSRSAEGRGGTFVFLHKSVRRNRAECRFEAICRGESPAFSQNFFREVPDFCLD